MSVFRGDEYRPARTYKRGRGVLFPGMWCALDNEDAYHDVQVACSAGMDARDHAWNAQWRRYSWEVPEFDPHHFSWRWHE